MIRCCLVLPTIGEAKPGKAYFVNIVHGMAMASYYSKCSAGIFMYGAGNFNDFITAAKENHAGKDIIERAQRSVESWVKVSDPVSELANYANDGLFVLDIQGAASFAPMAGLQVVSDTEPIWRAESVAKVGLRMDRRYLKHGENGRGNWPGQSVLLCSFDDAERKLPYSLAERNSASKRSWIKDMSYAQALIFYYENVPGLYHAFHSDDPKELNKIPNSVTRLMREYAML